MRFLEVKDLFQIQLLEGSLSLWSADAMPGCTNPKIPLGFFHPFFISHPHVAWFTISDHIHVFQTLLCYYTFHCSQPQDQSGWGHKGALGNTLLSPHSIRATQSAGLCPDSLWVPPRSPQPLWETFSMFNFLPLLPVIRVAHFILFQCHLLRIQYEFS